MDDSKNDSQKNRDGYRLIFRMWFKHPRSGKIIRTGRPIPIWVKA